MNAYTLIAYFRKKRWYSYIKDVYHVGALPRSQTMGEAGLAPAVLSSLRAMTKGTGSDQEPPTYSLVPWKH